MMKKSLLLTMLTFSIATPHKTLRAELSPGEIAGCVVAGAAALCGIYAIGKQCDVWGNPNPHELLACSQALIEQTMKYSHIMHAAKTCPNEDLLYTIAIDNIQLYVHAYQLESKSEEVRNCIAYMQGSRHYYHDIALQEQLRNVQSELTKWARDLRSLEDYLCKHAPYFALFRQEKNCLNTYAQEAALYNSYAYNPEYLRNQLYQQAQCKYHDTYAMISYIKQLERDITALESCINKAHGYNRAAIAQRIYVIMFYLYELVVNDPSYTRLVNDYHRFKAEQERLRIERERLEFERMQAAAERARLARERERAEYARIQAQHEREMHYQLQREREHAAYVAARQHECAQAQARHKDEVNRRNERERQERVQADARKKADVDYRNERERQERAQRRDAERRQREAEDNARLAKQREAEKKDPYRDYEEQERERKKRKREEKAAEEARKQQELKDEQYRYTVFDRFV